MTFVYIHTLLLLSVSRAQTATSTTVTGLEADQVGEVFKAEYGIVGRES